MENNEVKVDSEYDRGDKNLEKFYRSITSIQAIAVIEVILFHIGDITSLRLSSNILIRTFFEITESSVDIFVFLSGMLLTIGLIKQNRSKSTWGLWYKTRIVRIYPILIISTFFFVLSNYFLLSVTYSINTVKIHMSGLQSLPTNPNFFLIAPPHWYITLILSCYLLFPLFLYFVRKNAKLAAIIGFMFYICYLLFANIIFEISKEFVKIVIQKDLYLWYFSLFMLRYFLFFFGMLFGFWIGSDLKRIETLQEKKVGIITFLLLIIIILFYFFFPITNSSFLDFRRIIYHPTISILFILFSISFFSNKKRFNNILKIPGKESYEIYLFHLIIVEVMYYKIILFFSLQDIIELYVLFIPIIIILSIISAIPLYFLSKVLRNKEQTHKIILIISFSLIIYAIIIYLFNLEVFINNLLSILLFTSILGTLIFLNFFKFLLIKRKNKNLVLIDRI